jgi:uncharacterized DUF497 family protein
MALRFEWDPSKDTSNKEKHGVTFDEASTVSAIPYRLPSATLTILMMNSGSLP